jgi:hypothetical protein
MGMVPYRAGGDMEDSCEVRVHARAAFYFNQYFAGKWRWHPPLNAEFRA